MGNRVRAARLAGFLATGGLSVLWSPDDWHGNRLGELRVRADEVTCSELCALFHKCTREDPASFTLGRVKEYVRETGLRVAEYAYGPPRHRAVPSSTHFGVFLELQAVDGLTSHHGVAASAGGGGAAWRGATAAAGGGGGAAAAGGEDDDKYDGV